MRTDEKDARRALNGYHEVVTYLAKNQLTRPDECTVCIAH